MNSDKIQWRRVATRNGNSTTMAIPPRVMAELGIRPGTILQILIRENCFIVCVDPSQEPTPEEASNGTPAVPAPESRPAKEPEPAPTEKPASEETRSTKERSKDNIICAFDLL